MFALLYILALRFYLLLLIIFINRVALADDIRSFITFMESRFLIYGAKIFAQNISVMSLRRYFKQPALQGFMIHLHTIISNFTGLMHKAWWFMQHRLYSAHALTFYYYWIAYIATMMLSQLHEEELTAPLWYGRHCRCVTCHCGNFYFRHAVSYAEKLAFLFIIRRSLWPVSSTKPLSVSFFTSHNALLFTEASQYCTWRPASPQKYRHATASRYCQGSNTPSPRSITSWFLFSRVREDR